MGCARFAGSSLLCQARITMIDHTAPMVLINLACSVHVQRRKTFLKKAYVLAILAAAYAVTSIIRVVLETGSPRFQSNVKCCV